VGDKRLGTTTLWIVDGGVLASFAASDAIKSRKNGVGRDEALAIGVAESWPLMSLLSSFFVRLNAWQKMATALCCGEAVCAGSTAN
jgi:hypothetical protein